MKDFDKYIVRVIVTFSDGSKLPKYYEFNKLEAAQEFIQNVYYLESSKTVKYDVCILKSQVIYEQNSVNGGKG